MSSMTRSRPATDRPIDRWGSGRVDAWPSVAAERRGDDDDGAEDERDADDEARNAADAGLDAESGASPFGLPVLAEVPELAGLLTLAVDAERLTARLVEAIIVAQDTSLAAGATGVGLEQWLAIVARSTRSDRRMLLTAARVCRRLPTVRDALADGTLSWSQVRTIALRAERLPVHLDDRLDAAIARGIAGATDVSQRPDPDSMLDVLSWALAETETETADQHDHAADDDPDDAAPERDVLVLQPRLDGTGGKGWFDLGPVGFAALDTVTDPGPPPDTARRATGSGQAARTASPRGVPVTCSPVPVRPV